MITEALIRSLQVYGIAIALSMLVAIMIKLMVALMTPRQRQAEKSAAAVVVPFAPHATPLAAPGIPDEVVAAISGALTVIVGPHRVVHIAETESS